MYSQQRLCPAQLFLLVYASELHIPSIVMQSDIGYYTTNTAQYTSSEAWRGELTEPCQQLGGGSRAAAACV